MKDAFDLWWEWAQKPHESFLTIDADIHRPIMELSSEDRRDARRSTKLCGDTGKVRSAVPEPHRPARHLLDVADCRAIDHLAGVWRRLRDKTPSRLGQETARSMP
jgi:hypothetical protein